MICHPQVLNMTLMCLGFYRPWVSKNKLGHQRSEE